MGEPTLIHYSNEVLRSVHSVEQGNEPFMKPRGLWISVEDGSGWRDWCEGENWGLNRLEVENLIELTPQANILYLRSSGEISDFTNEFLSSTRVREGGPSYEPFMNHNIDWRGIAARWQGIIIAPYQWSCRLTDKSAWYYGWDCSSGCIWDAKAIGNIPCGESPNLAREESR